MHWPNGTPISLLREEMPNSLDLTLAEVETLAGIWKLVDKQPDKVFTWSYFRSAFGLSVSRARTRLKKLEDAGLLLRTMAGERPSESNGSRIALSSAGKAVCRAVSALFRNPETVAPAPTPAPTSAPTPAPAPLPSSFRPARFAEYPASFRQAILDLGVRVSSRVKSAIDAGETLRLEDAALLGIGPREIATLNDAIAKHARVPIAINPVLQQVEALGTRVSAPSVGLRRLDDDRQTRVAAADDASIQAAMNDGLHVPEVVEGSPVEAFARLVLAEAATRYRRALAGDARTVARRLNEIAWAVTKGPIADFGEPLKRVRVALSLVAKGRWQAPRGFDPQTEIVFSPPLPTFRS